MNKLTHVYYDQVNAQIVLFEANLDSGYKFIFEDKEIVINFKEIETKIPDRDKFIWLGTLED